MSENIVLKRTTGYMFKKGGAQRGGRRNWNRRWFKLESKMIRGQSFFELLYFESQKGKLKGQVALQGTEIYCERRSQNANVKYEFQILLQNGSTFQLSCDTYSEREEWIESLNLAITAMRKPKASNNPEILEVASERVLFEDTEESHQECQILAENCQAYGPGLFGSEAGQAGQLVVQMHDNDGQPMNLSGVPFTISLEDDECLFYLKVTDNDDGSYGAHYVVSRPGKFLLHVRLNDEYDISGSPFEVEILPSTTAVECCSAIGDTLTSIPAASRSLFTIIARDAYGNMKRRGGDPFEVGVLGAAKLHSLQDNGDGTYTCAIEAQDPSSQAHLTPPNLSIVVTLRGKHIAGSPFHTAIEYSNVRRAQNQPPITNYSSIPQPLRAEGRQAVAEEKQIIEPPPDIIDNNLNRLDRARQRAVQAKDTGYGPTMTPSNVKQLDSSTSFPPTSQSVNFTSEPGHRNVPLDESFTSGGNLKQRLSKLDLMAQKLGSGNGSTPGNSSRPVQSNAADQLGGLSQQVRTLSRDGMGRQPEELQHDDLRLWCMAHDALVSNEMVALLTNNVVALHSAFQLSSISSGAFQILYLKPDETNVGLYRLLEEFDVIPTYLSKKELNVLHNLVLKSEAQSALSIAQSEGLDFTSFLKLLVMACIFALSKTTPLSSRYSTVKAKGEVMLFNWGFADPLKIEHVKSRIRNSKSKRHF